MTRLIIVVSLLLGPLQAWAGWITCPGSTADTGTSTQALSPDSHDRQSLCYRFSHAGTTDPPRIDARRCLGGIDITLDSDKSVVGTNNTKTVFVYQCPATGAATTVADCEKILVDTTGDGVVDDAALNGDTTASRDAIYGISPTWLAFDVTDVVTNVTAELKAVCK